MVPSSIELPACGIRMGVTCEGAPGVWEVCSVMVVSGSDCGTGPPDGSTRASSAPVFTVWRGWATVCVSVPDCDASRCTNASSISNSTNASPTENPSPGCFSQRTSVAATTPLASSGRVIDCMLIILRSPRFRNSGQAAIRPKCEESKKFLHKSSKIDPCFDQAVDFSVDSMLTYVQPCKQLRLTRVPS